MISRSEGRSTTQVVILKPPHITKELSLTPIINEGICKACYFIPPYGFSWNFPDLVRSTDKKESFVLKTFKN